jgi:hypothetical protein
MLGAALLARIATAHWSSYELFGVVRNRDDSTLVYPVLVGILIGFALPLLNPIVAAGRIDREYIQGFVMRDAAVLPADRLAAREALGAQVSGSSCFVDLTNEGTWHYVFGKPACSRFLQVTNARSREAQREFVAALEQERPEWILVASDAWSNVVDGISLFNGSPIIAAYVLANYEPDRVLAHNWFWRRAQGPRIWATERIGRANEQALAGSRSRDTAITGSTLVSNLVTTPKAMLVTTDAPPRAIWSGRVDLDAWRNGTWSASVPTASLDLGAHRLQVWAAFDQPPRWVPLGDEVSLRLDK